MEHQGEVREELMQRYLPLARGLAPTISGELKRHLRDRSWAVHVPRPVRDRRILHLRFREDRIQSRIGEQVGLTQMQVSRVVRRSILRLQRAAGDQAEGVRAALRAGSS
jgi:DNA-directed RNA polymerase specialized sigma subunit